MPNQAASLASSEIDRCIFIPAKEVEEREQAAQIWPENSAQYLENALPLFKLSSDEKM